MKNEENTMNIFNKTDNYIILTFALMKLKNLNGSVIWQSFFGCFLYY